ncbi:hypothetical protein FA95DRAFT_808849 [Auriscalpium vulgare]|uniref:Uncharacterized protein n=1 Tax=Auriscalpium vulgare TaxID=40419 RepID=A0ACB8R9Q8_9AGAM|nr:hypothetical protein FA95DRAFT_808849 [Auriscalpium vulgare]
MDSAPTVTAWEFWPQKHDGTLPLQPILTRPPVNHPRTYTAGTPRSALASASASASTPRLNHTPSISFPPHSAPFHCTAHSHSFPPRIRCAITYARREPRGTLPLPIPVGPLAYPAVPLSPGWGPRRRPVHKRRVRRRAARTPLPPPPLPRPLLCSRSRGRARRGRVHLLTSALPRAGRMAWPGCRAGRPSGSGIASSSPPHAHDLLGALCCHSRAQQGLRHVARTETRARSPLDECPRAPMTASPATLRVIAPPSPHTQPHYVLSPAESAPTRAASPCASPLHSPASGRPPPAALLRRFSMVLASLVGQLPLLRVLPLRACPSNLI